MPPKPGSVKSLKKLFESNNLKLFHQEAKLAGAKVFVMVANKSGGGLPLMNAQDYREDFHIK